MSSLTISMQNLDTLSSKEYFHLILNEGIKDSLRIRQMLVAQALSQTHEYIKGLDSLPFRVLHHPLGATPEHVAGMLKAGLINKNNIFQVDQYTEGHIRKYTKSKEIPQVFQYQIEDIVELNRIVTDIIELARITNEANEVGESYEWPTISLMNPPALQQWAKYMGKRLVKDNAEHASIFDLLSGNTVEEKVISGGIPLLGMLVTYDVHLSLVGEISELMTVAPHEKESFSSLFFDRDEEKFNDDIGVSFDGISALLLEDKKVST